MTFTISGIVGSAISQPVTADDASASFTVPGGTPAGSYPIQASYHGTSSFTASNDASATLTILKATPTITWINPADITQGTALGPIQLNATASVPELLFTRRRPARVALRFCSTSICQLHPH